MLRPQVLSLHPPIWRRRIDMSLMPLESQEPHSNLIIRRDLSNINGLFDFQDQKSLWDSERWRSGYT